MDSDDLTKPLLGSGAKTKTRVDTYFLQVYSTVRRQITQKRRAPIALMLEILLPVLFAVLLCYVSTMADLTPISPGQFIPEGLPPLNFSTLIWDSVCYMGDEEDPYLRQTLGNCSAAIQAGYRMDCNTHHFRYNTPIIPHAICTISPQIIAPILRTAIANYAGDLQLLDLDTQVLLQWIIRLYYGSSPSSIFASTFGLNSMRVGGKLIFVPQTPYVEDVVSSFNATYKLFRYIFGSFANSREDVLPLIKSIEGEGKTWAVIEAYGEGTSASYTISMNRSAVPNTASVRSPFSHGLGSHPYANYFASGFLSLQQALSTYYLSSINTSLPAGPDGAPEVISVAPMPYVAFVDNSFFTIAGRIAPLVQVLSFLYTVSQLSKRLVEEKEQRLREGTMIMGLTRAAFFSSWMLVYYVQVFITTTISAAILNVWLLTKTVFPVTFFLYFLFGVTVVNMAALLSTFFNKSRIAALVVPLLYFMMSIPSFALPQDTAPGVFVLLSWIPPVPFSVGNVLLFNYQTTNGLASDEVANPNDVNPYNMATCYVFLAINIVFCPMLMLYLDAVLPKEWGSRRHPLYCFKWCFCRPKPVDDSYDGIDAQEVGSPLPFMKHSPAAVDMYPMPDRATTVHVRKVRKEFSTPSGAKVAVDDIDLRMFPGMVTVLLGHNGAGKTTLMNMMTGMLDMTGGDVAVYGKSVLSNLDEVRRNVGYCPQHNILWDDLTCIEHLRYFARLKGVPGDRVEAEAVWALERVDLLEKKNVYSKQLSGGQKRKLSVAIAFIGGSQLILLDEPTAGMDVTARRHTWEIIREMAEGRTILLTTHFMDEADLLGSRIAIMSKGRLHSYGSPMFLKSKLGSGYILRVSLSQTVNDLGAGILSEVTPLVQSAAIREVKGQEVSVVLHTDEAPAFPQIIRHLESAPIKAKYGITGVSMTVSTLEDVFLRIAEEEEIEDAQGAEGNQQGSAAVDVDSDAMKRAFETLGKAYDSQLVVGGGRVRQLWGLLVKRFHYGRRDNRTIIFQIAMPLLCLLLAMLLSYLGPGVTPRLWIERDMYGNTPQLVSLNNGSGIGAEYAGEGYNHGDLAFNSTYYFSKYLLDSYSSNGNQERFTSVSRRAGDGWLGGNYVYTTLFSNASAPHSAPESLQAYYQAVARRNLGSSAPSLRIASWPLPFTERQDDQIDAVKHLLVALFVLIPFTFIPSTYVSFIVKERECKAKHLQFVSGVRYGIYWLSNFIFDFIAFVFTAGCSIGIFFIFGRTEFIGSMNAIISTSSVLLLYGISGIFAAYSISFLFSSHSTAQNIVMIVNFVIGFCLVMASFIMGQMESTKDTMKWLVYVFRTFPAFCLGEGIMNIAITGSKNTILSEHTSLLSWDVTGCDLVFMASSSLLFMLITVIVDHPKRKEKQRMIGFNAHETAPLPDEEDEDVAAERSIINANQRDGDVIVVKGLRKVYSLGIGKEKVAVQNITFGVKKGEVFGFLGTNGAGKTTTMGVLTGEFVPTMGEAEVAGFDVVRQAQEAFKVIGYCPQFDALFDLLTPAEHLSLYASLRGIPVGMARDVVDALILTCGLEEFRKIPAMRLSGGNKRKLSVAVSLMGFPKLVFLDEPSAGMDPHARRQLWDVIVFIAKHSSVLLTTHHLEEVDVLAHRVGIMDKGLMKCLGSLEHLKRKFGGGFELTVRVANSSFEHKASEFVLRRFPNAVLVETREQRLVFALPADSTSLADLFEQIQGAQRDATLGISDYIVQQTSLENVFMRITAEVAEAEVAAVEAAAAREGIPSLIQFEGCRRPSMLTPLSPIHPSGSGYASLLGSPTIYRRSETETLNANYSPFAEQ